MFGFFCLFGFGFVLFCFSETQGVNGGKPTCAGYAHTDKMQ